MQPTLIALLCGIIPLIALNGALLISSYFGETSFCIPYIEGCNSISRVARKEPAIFLFRPLMTAQGVLMLFLWEYAYRWLILHGDIKSKRPLAMLWLGRLGVVFLIVYLTFLGSSSPVYDVLRRFGIIFFFCFTGFAEFLFVSRLFKIEIKKHRRHLLWVCYTMLLLGLLDIAVTLCMTEPKFVKNAIEWNFGVLLAVFSLILASLWKGFGVSYYHRA
jgi:hypothetical protein